MKKKSKPISTWQFIEQGPIKFKPTIQSKPCELQDTKEDSSNEHFLFNSNISFSDDELEICMRPQGHTDEKRSHIIKHNIEARLYEFRPSNNKSEQETVSDQDNITIPTPLITSREKDDLDLFTNTSAGISNRDIATEEPSAPISPHFLKKEIKKMTAEKAQKTTEPSVGVTTYTIELHGLHPQIKPGRKKLLNAIHKHDNMKRTIYFDSKPDETLQQRIDNSLTAQLLKSYLQKGGSVIPSFLDQ